MKLAFFSALALYTLSLSAPPLFLEMSVNELNQDEQKRFAYLKTEKSNKRLKVISLGASALSNQRLEVELFDGEKRSFEITKIEKEHGDSTWKGAPSNRSPGNHDRFSIMKIGKRYSGYVFAGGRLYLIQPAFKHHYVLTERDMRFSCGVVGKQGQGGK